MLYLAAGLVCAALAAFGAYKHLSTAEGGPAVPRTKILLARRDISYGELIRAEQEEGAEPNAVFVPWPEDTIPQGAFTRPEDIDQGEWRARMHLFKHEPILRPRLVKEDNFVPEGMYLERVRVEPADIKSGLLRAGMTVDVYKIVNRQPIDFMRCVKLYAVGSLDHLGRPSRKKKNSSNANVLLLIRMEHRQEFLAAKAAHPLLLREAEGACEQGPVLVEQHGEEERLQKAEAALERARDQADGGRYEDAVDALENVLEQYPDLTEATRQAREEMRRYRRKLGEQLYERAERALEEEQDFARTLSLLDRLVQECAGTSAAERAPELRERAQAALERFRRRASYQALLDQIEKALETGNLPEAESKLEELAGYSEDFEAPEGMPEPAAAYRGLSGELKSARDKYRVDRQVLESFLKQGNIERAREKLQQIEEEFPRHPENTELERLVRESEKEKSIDSERG